MYVVDVCIDLIHTFLTVVAIRHTQPEQNIE